MNWEVQTMQLKTSSYKKTWLKKNIFRFSPFWVLYTVCLLLGLFVLTGERDRFYFIMNLAGCARIMAVVNCGYALLTAQLLFGDLYDSRMCFGIHSLPMRREEIFSINVLSGFLFSLVPTGVMTLCALPLALGSTIPNAWTVPFLWFSAANLQYLFFFGLALVCVFCAGNRFSMAVIYGILNFGSVLLYLLVESLYLPLLPGVDCSFQWFRNLSPVVQISVTPLMIVERSYAEDPGSFALQGGSWIYLLTSAVLGVLLLLLALQMYRKRSLETAGEFISIKALGPVFLVLFALCGAMGLNLIAVVFFGADQKAAVALGFAAVGLIAGWFIGLMLMERTTKVFRKQAFLGMAILIGAVAFSLVLTGLDILGIRSWVPEPQEIEKVYMIPGYESYGEYWDNRENYALTEPRDLDQVTSVHGMAVEEGLTAKDAQWYNLPAYEAGEQREPQQTVRYTVPVSFEYHLKNGSVRRRTYFIYADGVAGQTAEYLFSRPGAVLRHPEVLDNVSPEGIWIYVHGIEIPQEDLTDEDIRSLMEALRMDCSEGSLAQLQEYHPVPVWQKGEMIVPSLILSVVLPAGEADTVDLYLDIYSDSTHTISWLQDRGVIQMVIDQHKNS